MAYRKPYHLPLSEVVLSPEKEQLLSEATLILGPHARDDEIRDHFMTRATSIPRYQRKLLIRLYRFRHAAFDGLPQMRQAQALTTPPSFGPRAAGHRCVYCGAPAEAMDHLWPRGRGGDDHPNNLRPACQPCNSRKGQRSLFGSTCPGCSAVRHPGDVDTATLTAYYHCRCGSQWVRGWVISELRL